MNIRWRRLAKERTRPICLFSRPQPMIPYLAKRVLSSSPSLPLALARRWMNSLTAGAVTSAWIKQPFAPSWPRPCGPIDFLISMSPVNSMSIRPVIWLWILATFLLACSSLMTSTLNPLLFFMSRSKDWRMQWWVRTARIKSAFAMWIQLMCWRRKYNWDHKVFTNGRHISDSVPSALRVGERFTSQRVICARRRLLQTFKSVLILIFEKFVFLFDWFFYESF